MKFLVDENIPQKVAEFLISEGHKVVSISVISPSISDNQVLNLAFLADHTLITSDKDFGELVYKYKQVHKGIILFRLIDQKSTNFIRALRYLFLTKNPIESYFTVLSEKDSGFVIKRRLK